jgi:hypothetical protein
MKQLILAGIVGAFILCAQQPQTQEQEAQTQQSKTLTGTLMDADCHAVSPSERCPVTDVTSNFGVVSDRGQYSEFDSAGTTKVRGALQTSREKTGEIRIAITGSITGEKLSVDSIQVQG